MSTCKISDRLVSTNSPCPQPPGFHFFAFLFCAGTRFSGQKFSEAHGIRGTSRRIYLLHVVVLGDTLDSGGARPDRPHVVS